MSEVLIDITRLLSRYMEGRLPTGVDRVSLEYVRYFANRACALVRFGGRWIELSQSDSQKLFCELLEPGTHFSYLVRWCVGSSYVFRWHKESNPRILLNTGHSGLDNTSYAEQVRRRLLQPIFFLHDIIPITHPEYCRPGEADKHHRRLLTMTSVGRGLIVNSDSTRAELEGYAQKAGLQIPPCVVVPLAPASLPSAAKDRPLTEPYFVVLGTIESRKNHLLLLNLWIQLIEEMGTEAPRLVVIGQRGWECEQVVDLLERCETLLACVVEVSRCTDAELSTWLHHAQALLFPSFVEGFGMPLVEAFSVGLPVIANDLPVFREIAGDIPEYLNPIDGLGWKKLILAYVETANPLRLAQLKRMTWFNAPTWDAHFAQVEGLLERVNEQRT